MSSPFTPPADQLAAYFNPSQPRDSYQDFEIDQIAILLQRLGSVASSCPRTYIILRTIDKLSLLEALLRDGFGDQWFPVEPASLPSFLNPEVKSEIVDLQRIILTKSLDMENGKHSHFAKEEALPFEFLGRLGSGAYGQVDRIQSKISFRQYALKRIRRRIAFGNNSKEGMKQFLEEMAILKKLEHKHVVRYVGSYTDKSFLGLVMSPVAEGDLAAYLRQACSRIQAAQDNQFSASDEKTRNLSSSAESSTIQSYFGCLAASLSYLHYQCIRHKDIKPQNILIHNGSILITDFGLSNDFADDYGSTTSGPTPASPRYCAPEVAAYESRNMSSDIWSLGCVYFEMVAALHGFSADWIKEYFITHNSKGSHYNANPEAIASLTKEWETSPSVATKEPLAWIRLMLRQDRQERPNAAQVLEMIISDGTDYNATRYCGMCCVPHDEAGSDDSLLNDLDITSLNLATEIQEKNVFTSGHPSTAIIPQVVPTANLPQLTAPQIQEILKPPRGYGASSYRRTEGRRGRKGTTKLPKRLVEKRAIIDLGYPFDEQDDFIIVTRALEKEQIDKIVKNSEKYQIENSPNLESQSSLTAQPSQRPSALLSPPTRPSASLPQYNTHVGDHKTSDKFSGSKKQLREPMASSENFTKSITPSRKVFGEDLSTSIHYAYMDTEIEFLNSANYIKARGLPSDMRLPIIVARCGLFLRHNCNSVHDLIQTRPRPRPRPRFQDSRLAFESPPDYGTYYDFGFFGVNYVPSLLYQYLASLPQPLIPSDIAQCAIRANGKTLIDAIEEIKQPAQDNVWFLLDLFVAVLRKDKHTTKQTSVASIAAVYGHVFIDLKGDEGYQHAQFGLSSLLYLALGLTRDVWEV